MKNIKTLVFSALVLLFVLQSYAQEFHLDSLATLTVPESSGLLYKDGRLITHNDSGDAPKLYELDTINGSTLREVFVNNASNVDWEDISSDADHLYIGDIGNNYGSRMNLKIYKITWSEFLERDTVEAQEITYTYADQVDFSSNQFFTPYDAEALVAMGDSLFLFTKDWSAARTKVYAMPKTPGAYNLMAMDSFLVPALITGADIAPSGNQLLFSAYSGQGALVFTLSDFTAPHFSDGTLTTWPLLLTGSIKSEGVCWRNERFAYISTEQVGTLPAVLYRLDTDFSSKVSVLSEDPLVKVYPQPATDKIWVETEEVEGLQLFNANGVLVLQTPKPYLDVSNLPEGIYTLVVLIEGQRIAIAKQVVVAR
ncbi:T9SS type A sorting domain-containing protein [Lewinella cohaerens]|uniref:T9SS type A sorting domain-containing protein n=1 Tax=Lewinella cohaerens TaxID=70995 RepID=UPI00035C6B68|nr:T9SS type A sorting domain-containing protein [Lewinella cohaerens]